MADVYGFDAYTARTIVRTIKHLQRGLHNVQQKVDKSTSNKREIKVLVAKTTLEPGGTSTAYRVLYNKNVITANTDRIVNVSDPMFTSFVIGMDDYTGDTDLHAFHATYDPVVRTWVPIGEHNLILNATPDSTIASGGSGTFSVYSGSTDTSVNIDDVNVSWGDSGEGVTSGKESWIKFNRCTKEWEWIGGDCES